MFERFRRKRLNREIVDRHYDGLVARARQPRFFEEGELPDTVMGRFDALAIEVFLFLYRCQKDESLAPLAQDLIDRFMVDMDHSMREIGIGYNAVPKRMRKLAGLFYQRVGALTPPLEKGDRDALIVALRQEKLGGDAPLSDAALVFWAGHIMDTARLYADIGTDVILAGQWNSVETGQAV